MRRKGSTAPSSFQGLSRVAIPRAFVFIKRADEQAEKREIKWMRRRRMNRAEARMENGSPVRDVGSVVFGVHQKAPLFIFAPPHPLIWRPPRQPLDAHSPPQCPTPHHVHTASVLRSLACLLFFNCRPSLDTPSHDELFLPHFFSLFLFMLCSPFTHLLPLSFSCWSFLF